MDKTYKQLQRWQLPAEMLKSQHPAIFTMLKSLYRETFEPYVERLLSHRFAVSMAVTVDAALRCRVADAAELSASMLGACCAASSRCPACDFVRAFHVFTCLLRAACVLAVGCMCAHMGMCACAVRVRVNLRSQCSWASFRACREGAPPSLSLAFSPSLAVASAMLVYRCSPCRRSAAALQKF